MMSETFHSAIVTFHKIVYKTLVIIHFIIIILFVRVIVDYHLIFYATLCTRIIKILKFSKRSWFSFFT